MSHGGFDKETTRAGKIWNIPYCWAVRTYKHLNISSMDFEKTESIFSQMADNAETNVFAGRRDIAYGNYDRIQLIPVNTFSDFTDQSYKAYGWYGSSQVMLLFPLEENDSERSFVWGHTEEGEASRILLEKSGLVENLQGFFAVSFCYISDEVRNAANSYESLLRHCRDSVKDLVSAYNEMLGKSDEDRALHGSVTAEVFGSFSSAEIVILWSSRQYTDVLYLIDCIRDFKFLNSKVPETVEDTDKGFSVFRTTYTMISFPDLMRGDMEKNPSFSCILGRAHLQFVMQNGFGEKNYPAFRQFLEQCLKNVGALMNDAEKNKGAVSLRRCAGEYDLLGEVDSKYLPRLFSNPRNWKAEENPSWEPDPDDPDYYYCSVHHPVFRKYVQYSFTRLSYEETDLPGFTRSSANALPGDKPKAVEWTERKKEIAECNTEEHIVTDKELTYWKSSLIREIQETHKPNFEKLIQTVEERIPGISNLRAELQQLFSDYVQCCCSSADYLWIEDYNELFQQTLERIRQSICNIQVWNENASRAISSEDWKDAREGLRGIRMLMQALLQQTSHITASGKLFFKEQDVHFGYTAQHDLVIHAYYDIIKQLIRHIYSYTDPGIQSQLYPLVNFCPEDRISSQIFTEESAGIFLSDYKESGSMQLRARVMAIHIPLDGMDNLMHYLPMLVHEVYHYAAPEDRRKRNLALAKIIIYQTLRRGFFEIFQEAMGDCADQELVMEPSVSQALEAKWQACTDQVFYDLIHANEDMIYRGLKGYYFWSKGGPECDESLIEEAPILRSWFITWLQNWLNDNKKRYYWKNKRRDPEKDKTKIDNFSDFFPLVFSALEDFIQGEKKALLEKPNNESKSTLGFTYLKVLDTVAKKIQKKNEQGEREIFQDYAEIVARYVNQGNELSNILEKLDEVFPDMAMVVLTGMPAHGYMLQIALDLDSQLYMGEDFYSDQIRFASVLHWIFCRDAKANVNEQESLRQSLDEFTRLYIAAYGSASSDTGSNSIVRKKAEKWRQTFEKMYLSFYSGQGFNSFGHIRYWTAMLIDDMGHCLNTAEANLDSVHKCSELFAAPYHKYLEVLKLEKEEERKEELLRLSIRTILNFQRRQSLRLMNEQFADKHIFRRNVRSRPIPAGDNVVVLNPWETRILSLGQYYTAVQYALGRLYHYRNLDMVPSATGMWYRGISHAEYPVLPSGFVHFVEDAGRLRSDFPFGSPYYYMQAQLHNYETFRYSVEGASIETDPARYHSMINYLALMQHYGQHTNLLDWSEDSFASTYFALEAEININDRYAYERMRKKQELLPDRDADAALYILDPVRFNKACDEIEKSGLFTERVKKSLRGERIHTTIPNLSIEENRKAFDEFCNLYQDIPLTPQMIHVPDCFPGNNTNKPVSLRNMQENFRRNQKLNIHLPRAVYTAKLNPRIRAQSGLFVAFSLKSRPAIWEGKEDDFRNHLECPNAGIFSYQALETIQDYYVNLNRKNPFLMKIIIPASLKEEMGKMLYQFGISKERIYPELQNYRNR